MILRQAEQWPERCGANWEDPDRPGNLVKVHDEPPRGYPRAREPHAQWREDKEKAGPSLNDLYNEVMDANLRPTVEDMNNHPERSGDFYDFGETDRHWPAEYNRHPQESEGGS